MRLWLAAAGPAHGSALLVLRLFTPPGHNPTRYALSEHASNRLLQAHMRELEVREAIAENILRVTERQQQLLLLSVSPTSHPPAVG